MIAFEFPAPRGIVAGGLTLRIEHDVGRVRNRNDLVTNAKGGGDSGFPAALILQRPAAESQ